jgi:hypothetical protein
LLGALVAVALVTGGALVSLDGSGDPLPRAATAPSPSAAESAIRSLTEIPTKSTTPRPSPVSSPTSARAKRAPEASALDTGPARPSPTCGREGARVVRFRVAVDHGLRTTAERFMNAVLGILCDERSWIGSGNVRFRYHPDGALLIGLHTGEHKDELCYPYTGYGSCQLPGHVVVNADRWFGGSAYWDGPVQEYRRLVINHEVGHALGQRHRGCTTHGGPAPVMMQQSLGLTTDGRTCRPNPWPLGFELRSVR